MRDEEEFDYIVTGAGSAGAVMAARLSENGRHRVLLLEAGGPDRNPWIHIPLGYAKLFTNPAVNWMYESEPEPALHNRTLYQPRGKVLGGTSSINGMIYMRGTPTDYDTWRQLGCTGWGWEDVLPFFRKAEDQARGEDELHGVGGPLHVSDQPRQWPLAEALLGACLQAGIPPNKDFNGPVQEGAGPYQTTTWRGRRWSTASAYLRLARKRANLTIRPHALAARILIQGGRATGVAYLTPGGERIARARAEVIVSGGVFNSPQLLQLSGIGPAAHLREMMIPPVHDLPGVGANLHDHFNTTCTYRCAKNITLNELDRSLARRLVAGAQYMLNRSGPMAGNGLYAGAFLRSDKRLAQPDLQINIFAWSVVKRDRHGVVPHPFPGFTLSPVHLRPEGRGSVRLRSPDPLAPPEIRFNFLRSEADMQAMIAGIRAARMIARQPALRPYMTAEIDPGPTVLTDEELAEDVRERGVSNLHPVGTCRMGTEPDAVVDARLRVHGVGRLRVVDASIMPAIIAGNTNAPTIMIAEKAAAMVLEDAASLS